MDNLKKPEWTDRFVVVKNFENDDLLHNNSFEFLHPRIIHRLQSLNVHSLFPIQAAVIPFLIHQRQDSLSPYSCDICISAETGQGKTFCYVLPIVHNLIGRTIQTTRCITIIPTRELALQVSGIFKLFSNPISPSISNDENTNLQVGCLVGQTSFASERQLLNMSPDIIVCTPGRLVEHYHYKEGTTNKGWKLSHLKWIVIDEADTLLTQSFQDWYNLLNDLKNSPQHDVQLYTSAVNRPRPVQKLLLSATMTKDPQKLAKLNLIRPIYFLTASKGAYATPKNLSHYYFLTKDANKPMYLLLIIKELFLLNEKQNKEIISHNWKKLLIFCKSKEITHRLTRLIQIYLLIIKRSYGKLLSHENKEESKNEFPVFCEFSGKHSQNYRNLLMEQFRANTINALICSDVAARGLDITDIDIVINYDVPHQLKTYIHRTGRTARAGRSGKSITLLKNNQIRYFKSNLSKAGIRKNQLNEWCFKNNHTYIPYDQLLKMLEICLEKENSGHMAGYQPLTEEILLEIESESNLSFDF